jgi:hypothetical protein
MNCVEGLWSDRVDRVFHLLTRLEEAVCIYSQLLSVPFNIFITYPWSLFIRCSVYSKCKVKFLHSSYHVEHCSIIPLTHTHKTQLNLSQMCF